MKTRNLLEAKFKDGTLVFCNYKVLRLKYDRSHNGEPYKYTEFYDNVDEFFKDNPRATYVTVNVMQGGELVHGVGTYNRNGYCNDDAILGHEKQFKEQHGHGVFSTGFDKNWKLITLQK